MDRAPGLSLSPVAHPRWIADLCGDGEVIVAGDLNATVDHLAGLGVDGGSIGGCRDAAAEAGSAAAGTWPVRQERAPAARGRPQCPDPARTRRRSVLTP